MAQLEPEFVPFFFAAADKIADDLATNPPTEDELERVTAPLAQRIRRASTGNQFWLYNLEGATTDPARVRFLRSLLADYSQTTPEIMLLLADRYFVQKTPLKLAIIPEGQDLAETPPASAIPDVAPAPTAAQRERVQVIGR